MNRRHPIAILSLSIVSLSLSGCAGSSGGPGTVRYDNADKEVRKVVQAETQEKMVKYGSNEELDQYFVALQEAQAKRDAAMYSKSAGGMMEDSAGPMPTAAPPADAAAPEAEAAADGDDSGGESITNTQEQGVDEGGIVKAHGDHLVVLRRGRLWTAKVGDGALKPVSMLDVRPNEGHDSWYDEMLIHDDKIVVVGFSYMAGATELGLFHIDKNGKLRHEDTFFLKSNDYYSSRNYASRLLGDKLVFYMPYNLGYGWDPKNRNLPGVAKHRKNQTSWGQDDWDQVIDATDIYRPVQDTQYPVLHTVVTCDLDKGFKCNAQGILAPYGRTFYVSKNAVYVWVNDEYNYYDDVAAQPSDPAIATDGEGEADGDAPLQVVKQKDIDPTSVVYRLSLDGGAPGAMRVWGSPVDQFSFKESSDGYLNVLVRSEAQGDTMWNAEFAYGDAAMLRVPTQAFDSGVVTASADAFTDLPDPEGDGYAFQNRFVGDYLLYGNGSGWGYAADAQNGKVYAHPYTRNGATTGDVSTLNLPHGVDRIEAMGSDAVIVGSDGQNLHFSALDLDDRPFVAGKYVQRNATQGETRSHGFFYKPTGKHEGMLGLPIRGGSAPGYEHLMYGSASLLYLSVKDLNFSELGSLASSPEASQDDSCQVSCVDWYGNARPIFYQGRVFALLGYELVEGAVSGGRSMSEVRRINLLDAQTRPKPKQMAK